MKTLRQDVTRSDLPPSPQIWRRGEVGSFICSCINELIHEQISVENLLGAELGAQHSDTMIGKTEILPSLTEVIR